MRIAPKQTLTSIIPIILIPDLSQTNAPLMSNVSQQLENFQAESGVSPDLHAARQVAYWSSILVSMVLNSAVSSHPTTSSISTASVIIDCQPTTSIPLTAVIANH